MLLVSPTVRASENTLSTVLGRDGQLVSLVSGSYGDLVPSGDEASADVPILALRSTFPDGQESLDVVPATLDLENEEAAELVIDPVSGKTYVFWQSWTNLIHCRLLISFFDGAEWSEPLEVAGSAFAWRTSPTFAVTHDSYLDLGPDDQPIRVHRTVLHVVWTEETADGFWNTMYAPLVLEDGAYIGHHVVLTLNDLVAAPNSPSGAATVRIAPALKARNSENGSRDLVSRSALSADGHWSKSQFVPGELSWLGRFRRLGNPKARLRCRLEHSDRRRTTTHQVERRTGHLR